MWFHLQPATLQQAFVLATAPGSLWTPHVTEELLRFADGIICVADSQRARIEANLEALAEVERFARPGVPLVFQWNKRDLADLVPIAELEARLNPFSYPSFEAVAHQGTGVFATLRRCAQLVAQNPYD
ncbi:MAG: hypothetical protein QM817_14575 [Archangium sp.]